MKMNFMIKLFLMVIFIAGLSGCMSKPRELKSPCVGAEGSPCARRPVNSGTA